MDVNSSFYRPEWTCGRHNKEHNAAIIYNLIEGMCFYYEDISAEVVGCILSVSRNKKFDLKWLSKKSNVTIESLLPFIRELINYGLLTTHILSREEINLYRNNLKVTRKQQVSDNLTSLHEMTIVGTANAERMYMDKVGGITSVMCELTYRCSEMCIHCYNAGATRNNSETNYRGARAELSIDDYKKVIDDLCSMGLTKVCLSGGDPFSKFIVWDIIAYLYEKELAVDIFTNGISVVDKVENIARFYPRTIGISLYSDIAEIHDSITRVKGSHDKTISFIEGCSRYALPILLKCCIMKQNVSSYRTVMEVGHKYGALAQFDLNITDSTEGDKFASTYLRLGHEELMIVLCDKDLPYYISGDGVKNVERNDEDIMCNAGLTTLCVTPEGNVQPCCAFPLKLGNVRDMPISKIIETSQTLQWWRNQTIKNCSDCYKHPYCTYCQMCVGNNYIAHGNPLRASDNNCFLARERYDLAMKMKNGFDPLNGKTIEEALSEIQCNISVFRRIPSVNHREDARINEMS